MRPWPAGMREKVLAAARRFGGFAVGATMTEDVAGDVIGAVLHRLSS